VIASVQTQGAVAVGSSAVLGCWFLWDIISIIGHIFIIIVLVWLLVDMTKHLHKWRHEREQRYGNQNHGQDNQPKSKTLQLPRRIRLLLGNKNTDSNLAPLKKRRITIVRLKMQQLQNLAWVCLCKQPLFLRCIVGFRKLFWCHSHKCDVSKQPNDQELSHGEPKPTKQP
jgi:hypothetical protein